MEETKEVCSQMQNNEDSIRLLVSQTLVAKLNEDPRFGDYIKVLND